MHKINAAQIKKRILLLLLEAKTKEVTTKRSNKPRINITVKELIIKVIFLTKI